MAFVLSQVTWDLVRNAEPQAVPFLELLNGSLQCKSPQNSPADSNVH